MGRKRIGDAFFQECPSFSQILIDRGMAQLGDSYVNFIYSLALSNAKGIPVGVKLKGSVLAEALKKAHLREYLPSRMTTHGLADAAEALLVYGWLSNCLSIEESVMTLIRHRDPIEAVTVLLQLARSRIKLS